MKRSKEKREKHALPGSAFSIKLQNYLLVFCFGAIDNITKDGGIEVMLLYAFYLQVADCTIASYFILVSLESSIDFGLAC